MTQRLKGQTAIIVGAGQSPGTTIGNGRAMATLFAREGANVMCVDNRIDSANETVDAIKNEGGQAFAFEADITDTKQCAKIAAQATEQMAKVDILVNNVGIGTNDAPIHAIEESAWDHIMDVNLKSMAMTIRHVLPIMRKQKNGAIINISSLAAVAGHHMVTYEVSKMAVNRLTTVTALSNAKYNIRCNCIQPGLIDTPMAIEAISAKRGIPVEQLREERNARVPLGRMGTGWEIAETALFLASNASSYITGTILPVDGGMGARIG